MGRNQEIHYEWKKKNPEKENNLRFAVNKKKERTQFVFSALGTTNAMEVNELFIVLKDLGMSVHLNTGTHGALSTNKYNQECQLNAAI
jgi:hypothetical protein